MNFYESISAICIAQNDPSAVKNNSVNDEICAYHATTYEARL